MDERLDKLLHRISLLGTLPRITDESRKRLKLTPQQIYTIFLLGHAERFRIAKAADLCVILGTSPSTLSRNLHKLIERKVLEKHLVGRVLQFRLLSQGQLYFRIIDAELA